MKHLKLYELYTLQDQPRDPSIGDYVLIRSTCAKKDIVDYVAENIGQISDIRKENNFDKHITVLYDNLPEYLKKYDTFEYSEKYKKFGRSFAISQITNISNNKENLEKILIQNKYNL